MTDSEYIIKQQHETITTLRAERDALKAENAELIAKDAVHWRERNVQAATIATLTAALRDCGS